VSCLFAGSTLVMVGAFDVADEPVFCFTPPVVYRSSVMFFMPAQMPVDHESSVMVTTRDAPLPGFTPICPQPS
jgi:hypothetical protein